MGKISVQTQALTRGSLANLRKSIAAVDDVIARLDEDTGGRGDGALGNMRDMVDTIVTSERALESRIERFIHDSTISENKNKSLKLSRLMKEIFPDEHVEHFLDQQFELVKGKDYDIGNGVIRFKKLPKDNDLKAQTLGSISAQMNHMNLPSHVDIAKNCIFYTIPAQGK